MNIERIILATGGTGGHIFPAIAVAEEIMRRSPKAMVLFMGSQDGVEADIVTKAGFNFAGLPVRGIIGKGSQALGNSLRMLCGVAKARAAIKKVKPQVVIGFGGFAAFAGTLAGTLAHRPTALHEQNSYPGLANRILGKTVQRVFLSMADASPHFPAEKIVFTGNPVRQQVTNLYSSFAQRRQAALAETRAPRLLVMGGSLGAQALNTALSEVIPSFLKAGVEVWHQTGKAGYEQVRQAYRSHAAENVRVEAFIDDMAAAYQWADLVLCRAGASSLAELTAVGLPSVLVPFPFAAQDHQRKNALSMEKAGASLYLDQKTFANENPSHLANTVLELLSNKERIAAMASASHALAKPEATNEIVNELEKIARA